MTGSLTDGARAFTLIELLVVVAIIAILAAIALPNFIEAQMRAKITRVRSDFRTVAVALEAYAVDFNRYPPIQHWAYLIATLEMPGSSVTTPTAYLTSIPRRDPLGADNFMGNNPEGLYQYFCYMPSPNNWIGITGYPPRNAWSLVCWGPDMKPSEGEHLEYPPTWNTTIGALPIIYDPTNGAVSEGDIVRFGGATQSLYAQGT
ncbi:prepilin-type N-terminal cleavage/methylation domain-containing protein [Candidatus Sumerlaeota bacterium]|nr:prepilin-type N-terminal cleavage/methylation domain-containing protein [Candidatus Sumerlaeota bacterium]